MIDTVLVPFDGTEHAESAVEYVGAVFPDRTVVLLTVIDPVDGFAAYDGPDGGNWREQARTRAEELLGTQRSTLPADTAVETVVTVGNPPETIAEAVETHDADQIVIGSHGRSGIRRVLVGSVAEHVARSVSVPTTIV
jgi:nucleotide-binding universal stress UspA family protein